MPSKALYCDEARRILNVERRDLAPEEGARGFTPFVVRGVNVKQRTVSALVSTPNVDRYEEIVQPEAFAKWLPTFMTNPVCCANHTYTGPAGEPTVIGQWTDLRITEEGLIGVCKFMDPGDPLTDAWWARFQQGTIRAFSVGWITHKWVMKQFPDPADPGGGQEVQRRVFTEVELIEISAVAIPANRESLVRAAGADAGAPGMDPAPGESEDLPDGISGRGLTKRIARAVKPALRELLNTDPGGELHQFIAGVCEATVDALRDRGALNAEAGHRCLAHGEPSDPYDYGSYDETGRHIGRAVKPVGSAGAGDDPGEPGEPGEGGSAEAKAAEAELAAALIRAEQAPATPSRVVRFGIPRGHIGGMLNAVPLDADGNWVR